MDFEKLIDKFIEEPKRERSKLNVNYRLQYKNAPDENNTKLILAGVIVIAIIFLLWLFNLIRTNDLVFYIIFVPIVFSLIYQYRPRYCKTCSNKMVRQQHDNKMYYFCDSCKTKFETGMGTDASG